MRQKDSLYLNCLPKSMPSPPKFCLLYHPEEKGKVSNIYSQGVGGMMRKLLGIEEAHRVHKLLLVNFSRVVETPLESQCKRG